MQRRNWGDSFWKSILAFFSILFSRKADQKERKEYVACFILFKVL